MSGLLNKLRANQRTGSKVRCHLLTHGEPDKVAENLTDLIKIKGVAINKSNCWMPRGFCNLDEAQLHGTPNLFPEGFNQCDALRDWWLRVVAGRQTLPSFDIAASCMIGEQCGLLLVEAKAHHGELLNEQKGKSLEHSCTDNAFANHLQIGQAIAEASAHLQRVTGLPWAISRDNRYQMSNRFAWAWKVASLGVPVVLVYLGFLNAKEMPKPFKSANDWEEAVYRHSCGFVPQQAWKQPITFSRVPLRAAICSTELSLPSA